MAQRISMVKGVAQVQVYGEQKYAVRVQLDPKALTARGIGIDEVTAAIQRGNVNLPTGLLTGAHKAFSLQATGQLTDAAAYRPLIVAYRNGSPVRLEQLGRVIDSVQNNKVANWFNTTRAEVLAIRRQPGTNTVEVVDNIKKLLPSFRSQIPASVRMDILYDRSKTIRDSIRGRQVYALSHRRPRGHGHLSLPPELVGHGHTQPGAAGVHHRHLCGHVSPRLHGRQFIAHGIDPFCGICGGRCHRHAGKHCPAYGKG